VLRALAGSMTFLSTKASQCAAEDACCTRLIEPGTFAQRGGPSLRKGAIDRYIRICQTLGIDIVEVSSGFVAWPTDDWLRLIERSGPWPKSAAPVVRSQRSRSPRVASSLVQGRAIAACGAAWSRARANVAGI
jgi:hypothetical protein